MIHKLILCIICATFLGACASNKPEPLPRVVRVEVPVILPCPVIMPPIGDYATAYLTKGHSDFDKIKALLVEREERKWVELELRELLGACITH